MPTRPPADRTPSGPLPRPVRLASRLVSVLSRVAISSFDATTREEYAATIEAACHAAYAEKGWTGLARTTLAESAILAGLAVRNRPAGDPWIVSRRPGLQGLLSTSHASTWRFPMTTIAHDVRLAWRNLGGGRATTALAVLTLALGLGVNTAVFSVLDAVIFRPVPYAQADRLSALWSFWQDGSRSFAFRGGFKADLVAAWRRQTDLFDHVEASEVRSFVYDDGRVGEMISGATVTPGLLSMLGVVPRAGRLFAAGDGRAGTDHVAIVSERFWEGRLGRSTDAVGRTILLNGERYAIAGILPASFRYPDGMEDVWVPFDVDAPPPHREVPAASFVPLVRLRPGLDRAQAADKVDPRGHDLNRLTGGDVKRTARLGVLGEVADPRIGRSLAVLGGAVLFLLFIVCVNVANLTLSRALGRVRDMAVRAALGASRAAIVRETLVEQALIGLAGTALAEAIARAAIGATVALLPDAMTISSLNAIDFDARTALFLAAAALVTTLASGLPPAFMASRASIAGLLGGGSRSVAGSGLARRLRGGLVVVEVSLSIVLLAGAALMARSVMKLQAIDIGLDARGLVAVQVALPAPAFADAAVRDAFAADLVARLRKLPGVVAASDGAVPPAQTMVVTGGVALDGGEPGPEANQFFPVFAARPGYFGAAGIRILEGRELQGDDLPGAAVVSRGFAAKYWPGRSAVGRRFRVNKDEWRTVVGVASEVRPMTGDQDAAELYFPPDDLGNVYALSRAASTIAEYRTFIVRAAETGRLLGQVPAAVHAADSRAVVSKATVVAHEFADAIARPRVVLFMLAVFAGFGLVLAAAGLYGVLSHLVAQRRREIGIRLALGARPAAVGRLVMRSGLGLTAVGLACGLLLALGLVRTMRALLFDVDPSDPVAIGAVVAVLIATAVVASWRPARQAMRVDPVSLLRSE